MGLSFRQRVARWIESAPIQNVIIGVIIFNAITPGREGGPRTRRARGNVAPDTRTQWQGGQAHIRSAL